MTIRVPILLILLGFVAGCSRDVDSTVLSSQPLKITIFRGGQQVGERLISPPSRVHDLLVAWAEQHKDKWRPSHVTYAPSTLVTGTNFSLNIRASRVVLNIYDGRQRGQYERDASASDFEFLSQEQHR